MAAVRQRGPFSFQVYSKVDGKQVIHGVYDTREVADEIAAKLTLASSRGTKIEQKNARVPMRTLLEVYRDEYAVKRWEPGSAQMSRMKFFLKEDSPYAWLVDKKLVDITYEDIEEFIEQRMGDDDVSGSTVNRDLNFLSPIFNWGRKKYKCMWWVNPVADSDRPKNDDERNRVLTDLERPVLEPFVQASPSSYLSTAYLLALHTGMRRGEIAKADWKDFDESHEDAVVLHIPKANTKTKKGRGVPIQGELLEHLRSLKRTDGPIIGATSSAIGQAWKKAVTAANIDDLRFHDLRHTALTRMAATGMDALHLSQISGHASMQMLRRYVNPTPQELARMLAGLTKAAAARKIAMAA